MLKQIFPTYLYTANILDSIDVDNVISYIDSSASWEPIRTYNMRCKKQELTDRMGKVWDMDYAFAEDFDSPVLIDTFDVIKAEIEKYYKALETTQNFRIENAWVHYYDEDQAIDWHNHRGVETVGVLYLDNYKTGGETEFIDPKEYILQNEPACSLRTQETVFHSPKIGDLIFFPGYLKHRSLPGHKGHRKIIGFHFRKN